MAKHTEGPWQVGNFKPNAIFTGHADGPYEIGAFKRQADAVLAASAPALLTHLEFAVKLLSAFGHTAQVQAMHAAIAKARGQVTKAQAA